MKRFSGLEFVQVARTVRKPVNCDSAFASQCEPQVGQGTLPGKIPVAEMGNQSPASNTCRSA